MTPTTDLKFIKTSVDPHELLGILFITILLSQAILSFLLKDHPTWLHPPLHSSVHQHAVFLQFLHDLKKTASIFNHLATTHKYFLLCQLKCSY